MSFIKEVLGLAIAEDKTVTKDGNLISVTAESTETSVINYVTDGGNYITFQQYSQDLLDEIIDLDHVTQEMAFCALIKMKIIEKRSAGSYIPPSEVYEQMKGKSGLNSHGYYRKKSNSKGSSFGFDLETVNRLNNDYKANLVDLLQAVEDELDTALEEAKEFGDFLKQKHRENSTGKPSVHMEIKALFEVSKRKIVKKHLEC